MTVKSGAPLPKELSNIQHRAAVLWFEDLLTKQEQCDKLGEEFDVDPPNRTTLYRWAAMPAFQEVIVQLRSERSRQAIDGVIGLLTDVPKELGTMLRSKYTEDRDKLRACAMILDIAREQRKLDYEKFGAAATGGTLGEGPPEDAVAALMAERERRNLPPLKLVSSPIPPDDEAKEA